MLRQVLSSGLLLAACSIGGCGTTESQPAAQAPAAALAPVHPETAPAVGLPASNPRLLLQEHRPRGVSYTEADLQRDGGAFDTELPRTRITKAGSFVTFSPAHDAQATNLSELAYCHYLFNLAGYDRDPSLRLSWDTAPAPGLLWLGLADVAADSWDWFQLDGPVLVLDSLEPYVAAEGRLLLAVVLLGDQPAVLSELRIGTLPPAAVLNVNPAQGSSPLLVTFDASDSSDSDGSIVKYEWDFNGDGTFTFDSGTDPTVQRTFDDTGTFTPQVRVTDNSGASSVATDTVEVLVPPTAALQADPESGFNPLEVDFDASASTGGAGAITKYEWDFDGDGTYDEDTGAVPTTTYEYTAFDSYPATLRVTNDVGGTDTAVVTISVNESWMLPPVADLQADTLTGAPPLTVNFDASGSTDPDGTVERYEFDLDGNGSFELDNGSDPLANMTYEERGDHVATVRVTDNIDATDTASLTVHVNELPTADLTAPAVFGDAPFTVNFDASGSTDVDGTIATYEWDWTSDGTYDENSAADPTVDHTYATAGRFFCRVRVTDDAGEQAIDFLTIDSNGPPVCSFTMDPSGGDAPSYVVCNATASEPGGSIVLYEWDWEGDGTYDYPSQFDTVTHFFEASGSYTPTLRVTDDDGETATFSAPLTLESVIWWNANGAAIYPLLASGDLWINEAAGRPAMGYNGKDTRGDFSFACINGNQIFGQWVGYSVHNPLGSLDVELSTDSLVVSLTSKRPIACWNIPNAASTSDDGLYYGRATTDLPLSAAQWSYHKVEGGSDDVGYDNSLAVLGIFTNARPMISYYKNSSKDLRFARATKAAPADSGDWEVMNVDTSFDVGRFSSLEVVNNRPVIAYVDITNNALKYARATDGTPNNSGDWLNHTVFIGAGRCALENIGGLPAIAWYNSSTSDLRYARGTIAEPSLAGDWHKHVVVSSADEGDWPALTTLEGRPMITYYDRTKNKNFYAWATTAAPSNSTQWIVRELPMLHGQDAPVQLHTIGTEVFGTFYLYVAEGEIWLIIMRGRKS